MASLVTLAAAVSRPDVVKRSIHDMGANVTTPLVPPLVPNFSLPTKTAADVRGGGDDRGGRGG